MTHVGTGVPVPGVCVNAYYGSGGVAASTQTGSTGAYRLTHVFFGSGSLLVKVGFSSGCGASNYLTQYYNRQSSLASANLVSLRAGGTTSGINAAMVVGGQISGTVTDSTTLAPVAGVCVQAYDSGGSTVGSAQTDSTGAYTISALPTGSYRVGFSSGCGASNYLTQYYDDQATLASAGSVSVTQGALTSGIDAAMVEGAQLAGTVTDSVTLAPVAGICVQAYDGSGSVVGSAQTDSTGAYTISTLPTGSYQVGFSDCNNLGYVAQYYNDESSLASADGVSATEGSETSGIDAVMVPHGRITGTVTDSGTQAAIAGICVKVFDSSENVVASVQTDSIGAYTTPRLPAGSYQVGFSDCNGVGYVAQYYNDRATLAGADSVTVTDGSITSGIDAAMVAEGKITGTVTDSGTTAPLAGICVKVFDSSENVVASVQTNSTGIYTTPYLPAGSYRVGFTDCSGLVYVTQYYNDESSLASADPVTITSGTITSGIDAAMVAEGQITGTVTDSATQAAIAGICVKVYDSSENVVASVQTDSTGVYVTPHVPSGSYQVGFSDCNGLGYVAQYYNDRATLAGADSVTVTDGSITSGIDAAMVPHGQITGTVTDSATSARLAGICVQVYDGGANVVANMQTNSSGVYTTPRLPAGSYQVGFTDCNHLGYVAQYYNNKATPAAADAVTVTDGTIRSGIDAAMVPQGQITGTVTDSATSAPLAGICVHAYDSTGDAMASVQTNSSGVYTTPRLPSGSYRVGFTPCSGLGHIAQYYNDKATLAGADLITVTDGTTTSGIDAAMAVVPKVFAGYANTERTGPSHPWPWRASSNAVFEGCNYFTPSRCPGGFPRYDGGALRLDNPTAQAMTVTNATVTIGSCTFKPWPGLRATVPAGKSLILTQTGGQPPCGGAGEYNFNTSETNTSSTKCTKDDGKIPVFHVTVDGGALTYRDTGQVLNTGGMDPGAASCGYHSETHAWAPITALPQTGVWAQDVLALHPVAYWRLGELSGTVALDSSGNGHTAIYEGAPQLGVPGAITNDPNTAVGFDGIGQDAVWSPTTAFSGAFTVLAWIDNRGSTGNGEQTFFDTRDANGDFSFDFKLSFGNLKVDVGDGSSWFLTGPGIPFHFQLNRWYMVAAVVQPSFVTLYVNGGSIGSESYPTGTPLLYDPSHRVYLGSNGGVSDERFLGHMDEVAIYRAPLTSDEINGLYHAGIGG